MSVVPNAYTSALDFLGLKIGGEDVVAGAPMHVGRSGRACYRTPIIAEIGVNHNGDEQVAHHMIDVAADCGVDVVKFQKRDLDTLLQQRFIDRPQDAPTGLANLLPVLRRCELGDEAFMRLQTHAKERGLGFLVTPFDTASVAFLERLGVQAYKVASCDATNPLLLAAVAATGKPFLVSTGMTREMDVFEIVRFLERVAAGRFGLLHAVSGYPAAFSDCQLHMILRYKVAFKVPVGWSGHERGVAVSVGAVAAGADVLERHLTLDRTAIGPDHAASLEPEGMKKLVQRVRAFETAYGDPYMNGKELTRGETANHEALGKSLVSKCDFAPGEQFCMRDLEARSPGRGASPLLLLNGDEDPAKRAWTSTRHIKAGEPLVATDLSGPSGRADGPGIQYQKVEISCD